MVYWLIVMLIMVNTKMVLSEPSTCAWPHSKRVSILDEESKGLPSRETIPSRSRTRTKYTCCTQDSNCPTKQYCDLNWQVKDCPGQGVCSKGQ